MPLWVLAACACPGAAGARRDAPPGEPVVLREYLAIRPVGRSQRYAIHTDAIELRIVSGRWQAPREGEEVTLPDGSRQRWEAVRTEDDGRLTHPALRGGYAYASVDSPAERTMLLEASGHNLVYVNGLIRPGDPYSYGWLRLPVRLRAGRNDLLFQVGRGALSARLAPPPKPVLLNAADPTLPDIVERSPGLLSAAIPVVNATVRPLEGLRIAARLAGGTEAVSSVPTIPALSVRKVGFAFRAGALRTGQSAPLRVRLLRGASEFDAAQLSLRVRRPRDTRRVTFRSGMDATIQYYAVNPAQNPEPGVRPALVLSLHGASVEAIGQADAYAGKPWAHIVCPTNRRPYGFDWEDWGRTDALEVLAHAARTLGTDPLRTYLTGHSMGGHGAWHLAVTFPDRFGAVGPSAGWESFWTYGGSPRSASARPVERMIQRAMSPSDTRALARNLERMAVYVLHGDADDNVPPSEARGMRHVLHAFHPRVLWHEQPGAGHWWDASPDPGTDCVDWAPLFELFARTLAPPASAVRQVDFVTMSPGVSSRCHWTAVLTQQRSLLPSEVHLRWDGGRTIRGTTANVAALEIDAGRLVAGGRVLLELDGQKIDIPAGSSPAALLHQGESWRLAPLPPTWKSPERCGPFREVLRNRPILVYGTRGTPEENRWAENRARSDAEAFWYRGNGAFEVVPDSRFDPGAEPDRSVVLYGNRETNAAWASLLDGSPADVRQGAAGVGDRRWLADDLACLFVRPRPGSRLALVAALGGTGPAGMRLTDRIPLFVAGAALPDFLLMKPDVLESPDRGLEAAGFFGADWTVERGDFAYR